jgi:CRP-like cAMP-binding protein
MDPLEKLLWGICLSMPASGGSILPALSGAPSTLSRRGAMLLARPPAMATRRRPPFDPKSFLAKIGEGRTISKYRKGQIVFSQGDPADAVFYVQKGKVKVTVVSDQGKEAVIAILSEDEFCGEGCLAGQPRRISTVTAITECMVMRLEKTSIIRVLHDEPGFSELFISHLLARTIRVEEDLVDQLFTRNASRDYCCSWQILAKKQGPSR